MNDECSSVPQPDESPPAPGHAPKPRKPALPPEFGGPPGLEPTRYGDWESKGRCIDF
jgi:shikimate dehydrogenase